MPPFVTRPSVFRCAGSLVRRYPAAGALARENGSRAGRIWRTSDI